MTLNVQPGFLWNDSIWNPSMIATALWLDAADASTVTTVSSAVSQWSDKSGNARNATQSTAGNRPTFTNNALNGKSVITFNGSSTQHFVHSLNASPAPHSVFAVARRTTGGTTAFQTVINAIAPNNAFGVSLAAKVDGVSANWGTYINTTLGWSSSGSSIFNAWSIVDVISPTATSGNETLATNGSLTTVSYSSRYSGDANDRRAIGGDPVFNTGWLWGDIAEIIIITSSVSTDTRQRIEGYLAHKWGLEANLPNDHPYKTTGPTP